MDTGFLTRVIVDGGEARRYTVYVPGDYDPDRRWPAILFLHGAGEGGRDGLLPTEYQLGSAIRRDAARYPGLAIFPQCRDYQWVWSSVDVDFAMRVLDQVRTDFSVDSDRIYLTGVSTGAKAAWHALFRHAEVFAAALIVAGVLQPRRPNGETTSHQRLAQRIRDVAVWVFHGDDDPVFPVTDARDVVAALTSPEAATQPDGAERARRAERRYTELAGFGHDVWDVAYYSPEVTDWLFAQHRRDPTRQPPGADA